MGKKLSAIIHGINSIKITGDPDVPVSGLCYDSREVQPGHLYFALPGIHTDGHKYIDQAVARGAGAVICTAIPSSPPGGVTFVQVEDSRRAMSPVSAAFYDHPSRELTVIGVTGTDGKSSTVSFLHQMLSFLGFRCGFLSTVQFNTGGESSKNHFRQSTPEATEIHKALRKMVDAGCSHAVVESTSHGLSPRNNRLGDVEYDAAVITNISHEHLEFHGTMEQYMDDKANLFRMAGRHGGTAVVNRDDPHYQLFLDAFFQSGGSRWFSYSALGNGDAHYRAQDIIESPTSILFTIPSSRTAEESGRKDHQTDVRLKLAGKFNIDNILAATALLCEMGITSPPQLEDIYPRLTAVKGRMVPVDEGQEFQVIVDYAHTPGSFRRLFPAIRPLVKGRLFALFSSAGERDLEKRPVLGSIAAQYADIIFLADEDPRGENPMKLLRDVAAGCKEKTEGENLFLIEERREAMKRAFSMMRAGDCILLLGKGHEGSIIYDGYAIDWDEEGVARQLLRELMQGAEGGTKGVL